MTTETIAKLNDAFRKAGKFYAAGSLAQELKDNAAMAFSIAKRIAEFDSFTPDNDPYGEHDFGTFSLEGRGEIIFWKIDYYDLDMQYHSPDASDPEVTCRVLTVYYGRDH